MKAETCKAIEEIQKKFSSHTLSTKDDGQGGVYILLDAVDLGPVYTEQTRNTWIGFHIPFQYPFSDVYPHHVRPDLTRANGKPLGEGMQVTRYEGFSMASVQISRRSNHRDASLETALHKLLKVIDWASKRP